ncbi:MAG: aminoacyl-tRNA hydrolase [Corynebacteriales bacterium]|nr:aminoacyl-tRNA hydrolase [Mycobacteriales bacterium]
MTVSGELHLIVGLGNPGPQYAGNRHNVGFMVADLLAERAGARFKTHRAGAQVAEARVGGIPGHRVVVAKPMSFMNISGGPTAGLAQFYKVPVENIIVIHDELDIPFEAIRLKRGGGDNGHNGLRSITKSMGSPDYLRVRVGIGRPPGRQDTANFVLSDFPTSQRDEVGVLVERSADACEALLSAELSAVQNTYHAV